MAIISFWSKDRKSSGQTLSMATIATQMCIEHNMKTLMINAAFNDDTLERCYWNLKQTRTFAKSLNIGKIDIASGAEGLVSALASNKASPEIISSYTKIIFKNRLDLLPGLKTKIFEEHEKDLMLYEDLLIAADKYYDLVFIDLPKGLDREIIQKILEKSAVVVYTMPPNLRQIDEFIKFKLESQLCKNGKVLPLLTMSNEASKYNVKNTSRYIGEKKIIPTVPYNTLLMENASEAGVANMFLQLRLSGLAQDRNTDFLGAISNCGKSIIYKLQELQYKV